MNTIKKTVTAAEVRKFFLEEDMDETLREVEEILDRKCTSDVCQELLEYSVAYIPDAEIDKITVPQYAALCVTAKQSYITGFIHGTRAHMTAARESYEALFG